MNIPHHVDLQEAGSDLPFARQLLEAMDQPACVSDCEGRLLVYNRAAVEFWGTTPGDDDRWCPAPQVLYRGEPLEESAMPPLLAIRRGEAVELDELVIVRGDGSRRPFSLCSAPVRDAGGHVIGVLCRVKDFFPYRDLEMMRGRLLAIVQTSDDAIISTDLNGVITSWNRGAQRLYGYEPAEIIGRPTSLLIPADRRDEEPEVMARIRRGDVVDHYETVRRHKSGALIAVSLSVSPMMDERGAIIGASKIARDVTERQASDLIKNRLAAIVESSDDAIVSKDLNGIITTWNRGAERLFGYTAAEVIGCSITIVIPPERLDEEPKVLGKIMRGESLEHFETVRRRKDGTLIDISLTVSPIRNSRGVIVGASKIARDITERKRAERRLAEADRRKDEFLAMLSHELRNPLAPLRTSLDLLARSPGLSGLMQRMVSIMGRQVDHLVRLVDDLLEVSRISRGAISLDKEVVSLGEILRDAIEISRPLLEAKNQRLSTEIASGADPVLGDRVRLVQVIANVLNNAVKFTPAGGHVRVTQGVEGEHGVLRIVDDGVGIHPGDLEDVFEMFTQVGHKSQRMGGMGVGLSLARRLLQMHGGSIQAFSGGLGQGTEIRIRVPLHHAAVPAPSAPPSQAGPVAHVTRRILIVDDNRDAADALRELLRAEGHEAHATYDGASALASAQMLRPEVVLLDIGLPGMSGYEVAETLRQREIGRELVLVALTGWGQSGDREMSRQAGFDHHLVKPVDAQVLLRLLEPAVPAASADTPS